MPMVRQLEFQLKMVAPMCPVAIFALYIISLVKISVTRELDNDHYSMVVMTPLMVPIYAAKLVPLVSWNH